jgi:hypothetical protein
MASKPERRDTVISIITCTKVTVAAGFLGLVGLLGSTVAVAAAATGLHSTLAVSSQPGPVGNAQPAGLWHAD